MPTTRSRDRRSLRASPGATLGVVLALGLVLGPGSGALLPNAAGAAASNNAIEKQAVLKKADLPAGWTAEPDDDSDVPADPSCAGLRAANRFLEPKSTDSPDFLKDDLTRASNAVVVLKRAKVAKRWLEPYRAPEAITCLETLVKEAFSGPAFASVRVHVVPGEDVPRGADGAVHFAMQVTVTTVATAQAPAETAVLYWDLMVLRVGRALTTFAFLNLGRPLPEQDELVDTVLNRLQDAL